MLSAKEILPVRKWLSFSDACTYTGYSKDTFKKIAIRHDLTISADGYTTYYRVAELDKIFEKNIIKKQVI